MILSEVCKKYGVSESTMLKAFSRTQKNILKKHGVRIVKVGRGFDAVYIEEYIDDEQYPRALTLYDEKSQNIVLSNESLGLVSWQFVVFLAIITTPMSVFRGSYVDFLDYVDLSASPSNIENLKIALLDLMKKEYISYTIDKTNNNYFIAAIFQKVAEDMKIDAKTIKICKELSQKHNKRSWVPLLKTWLSINILSNNQPYTMKDVERMTGLSTYQIKEANKILKEAEIFKFSKAYATYQKCLGTNVDVNAEAFYNL